MNKLILSVAVMLLSLTSAIAHEYKIGDLMIKHPVARATPVNAPVSAGYLSIINMGTEADRLVGVEVTFAGKAEIHEMSMDGDVMKMSALTEGLEIPAGEEVKLLPGGYHLMFMKLSEQMKEGEKLSATLKFEKAGDLEILLNVETLAQIRETLGAAKQMEMKMDHSKHGEMKKAN